MSATAEDTSTNTPPATAAAVGEAQIISQAASVSTQGSTGEQVHFETDPNNELPAYTIGSFDSIFWGRHGIEKLQELEGHKLRITAPVDIIGDDDLTFLYTPQAFITDFFEIDGFGDTDLDHLHKGDNVEVVCEYMGAFKKSSDVGPTTSDFWFLFHGLEIHKTP